MALALGGSMADWPARFVFKVLEELEHPGKDDEGEGSSSGDEAL